LDTCLAHRRRAPRIFHQEISDICDDLPEIRRRGVQSAGKGSPLLKLGRIADKAVSQGIGQFARDMSEVL
jgi:hypothetical protein